MVVTDVVVGADAVVITGAVVGADVAVRDVSEIVVGAGVVVGVVVVVPSAGLHVHL